MNITPQDLKQKIESADDVQLLDVRETYEHEEFNIGGLLIPIGELTDKLDQLEEYKEKQIVVYCRSGNRSMMGQHILKAAGFSDVLNLEGGMMAWQET